MRAALFCPLIHRELATCRSRSTWGVSIRFRTGWNARINPRRDFLACHRATQLVESFCYFYYFSLLYFSFFFMLPLFSFFPSFFLSFFLSFSFFFLSAIKCVHLTRLIMNRRNCNFFNLENTLALKRGEGGQRTAASTCTHRATLCITVATVHSAGVLRQLFRMRGTAFLYVTWK